jgi:parallel beta-helix repeat protein
MMKTKIATMLMGIAFTLTFATRRAEAGIVVGACTAGTHYATIQAAVNAAPSGSTIHVCPAYYFEQVLIEKPLTLQGIAARGSDAPVIAPPTSGLVPNAASETADQILVLNTSGVTITNIAVDGSKSLLTCNDANHMVGITFLNASGTINRVSVRNQSTGDASPGCDLSAGFIAFAQSGTTATVNVENSEFRNIAATAIGVQGPGLTATITNNFVSGLTSGLQVGISIGLGIGAIDNITGNTVINETFAPAQFSGFPGGGRGIVLESETVGSVVSRNTIINAQTGIYLAAVPGANNNTITGNKIFNTSLFDGIYIGGSNNIVEKNTIVGSGQSGIHLDSRYGSGAGNTVSGNTGTEACAGILSSGHATNSVQANTFTAVFLTTFNSAACGPIF